MPGVTKEQIQAAREADLFAYLQSHESGVLKRDGPNYQHKEHDSLVYVTSKRYWYWNSRGRSINALDYLIQIRGYGLVDAVQTLAGGEIRQIPAYQSTAAKQAQKEPEKKPFRLPWARRCATAAVSYLQRRGISSDVISRCFRNGLFYEARYSKKFRAEHEADILLHQAAKKYFDSMGITKLPPRQIAPGGIRRSAGTETESLYRL